MGSRDSDNLDLNGLQFTLLGLSQSLSGRAVFVMDILEEEDFLKI
jgi:hypothetical protein